MKLCKEPITLQEGKSCNPMLTNSYRDETTRAFINEHNIKSEERM